MALYGIDLDGVCFDFMGAFCEWLHDKRGIEIPESEEITSYYWFECIDGLPKDVFWEEFHKFGNAHGYRDLSLLPGAIEGLNRIVDAGHEVMYITNRPKYALEDTKVALSKHNFPSSDRLKFANGLKSPVIIHYGVDVFIDDSPRTITEICVDTVARIYCMDYPFNRGIDVQNYTRVSSWEQFLKAEGIYGA